MILDAQSLFSNNAATGTTLAAHDSTNTLDWKNKGDDIDARLRWFVLLTSTATSAGEATLQVKWLTSADGSDWTTVYTGSAIDVDDCVAGTYIVKDAFIPRDLKRYNKLTFTVGTAVFTAAPKIVAGVTLTDQPIA